MRNIRYSILWICSLMLGASCSEPENWADPTDNIAPGKVTNAVVENLNGGAKISYSLPADQDLMAVKAVYRFTEDGPLREMYSSSQKNYIELEGFGDTSKRTITLYAVDNSKNLSEGVEIEIEPLTPPIVLMRESLEALGTFGGVSLTWSNEYSKDMAVSLYVVDEESNEMILFDTYFSNGINGKTVFRTFDAVATNFRIEMRDKWENYSEPLEVSLTPLAESSLPGRDGTNYIWRLFDDDNWLLRGDIHNDMSNSTHSVRVFDLVHDGTGQNNRTNGWWNPGGDGMPIETYIPGAGSNTIPFPLYFTVDMGKKGIYSRFNIKPRLRTPTFSCALPSDFEIWGTNDPKLASEVGDGSREANLAYWTSWEVASGTDAWKNDGWVRISENQLVLSTGATKYTEGMELSEEDIANYNTNGFDFDISESAAEGYRYLRWVIKDTNTGQKLLMIAEIEFWGSYTE